MTTGLRLGEALALRWQDIEPEHLNVRHTLLRMGGGVWELGEPKSLSGRRRIPLVAQAAAALEAQKQRNIEMRVLPSDLGFVFVTSSGQPHYGPNVYSELQKLLAKAGLPSARVHDLRHGTATYLLAAGVPPRTVMAIMGWSQISMLTRYQHVLDPMLTDAAQRLQAHLETFLPGAREQATRVAITVANMSPR